MHMDIDMHMYMLYMWFHHPSQTLPLTATVPRLSNGMERKAGRAYRSVLDLVVATCMAALVGAMSVVPPV